MKTALNEVNNAVLDLQSADYNTYHRPIQRLSAALHSESLRAITEQLKADVDFDAFVSDSDEGGSMIGSATLNWPKDRQKELGLAIHIIDRGAEDAGWFLNFSHHWYHAGNKFVANIRKVTTAVIIPFARDFKTYVESLRPAHTFAVEPNDFHRVFIVHGHDEAPRETVARFLSTVGLDPVILHEQANKGMTIPEKLAAYANVGFAVVLLTPDDEGRVKDAAEMQFRARQNVILELGYFVGRLGRDRVFALLKGQIEIPSDYVGVAYTAFDEGGGWRQNLALELEAAGYDIDWNKVMRRG
ncbi:nucleotide-binding protein [Loktanella salsilacus]|nr:nucleotide-binding protein [Loktanella salsilacus]